MKEVIAIIRPDRWLETRARLEQLAIPAHTQRRVLGRGQAQGLRYLSPENGSARIGVRFLPKRMFSWIVEDSQVQALVQALIEVNRTGRLGDGKIFVLPIEKEVPIGEDAEVEGEEERYAHREQFD